MPVKQILKDNQAVFVCPRCNREFRAEYCVENGIFADAVKSLYENLICDDCRNGKAQQNRQEEFAKYKKHLIDTLPERLEKTGLPKRFRELQKPPCRPGAEWIYCNRKSSLLISGETGSGKTSSAGFVLTLLLSERNYHVWYRTWQQLAAEFVNAKVSSQENELHFLQKLDTVDYLIIDELIGKKGDVKISPSGQELLFNIVDGVYSQARDTHVWVLGNFYSGAIDAAVDDPQPLRRRLQESFKKAWFNKHDAVETDFVIFNEKETME